MGVDVLDLPAERFATGGRPWQMVRGQGADPSRFGLGPNVVPDVSGAWFIRGRLLLDSAALAKHESLCWDGWSVLQASDAGLSMDGASSRPRRLS
jgi:hypothetical protein